MNATGHALHERERTVLTEYFNGWAERKTDLSATAVVSYRSVGFELVKRIHFKGFGMPYTRF